MALSAPRRSPQPQEDPTGVRTLNFLQDLFREYHPRNFAVELWDGTLWEPEPGQFRRFGWRINRPNAVRAAFESPSQVSLAEAYIYGDFDLEGDIEGVLPLADYLLNKNWSKMHKLRLAAQLMTLPNGGYLRPPRPGAQLAGRLHSRQRDRQAVSYHYDLSNDFYSLWLDKEMAYSCAYFIKPEDDFDTAQRQKLDYLCRKLRLRPGERLLDIGCGWGGLIIHAAREYGVNAVGITISQQQKNLAEERIQHADLAGRCQVRLLDYRDLTEPGAYDKIVSVGMVEHVGETNLADYFRKAFQSLRPGGVFLNHGIGIPQQRPLADSPNFVDLYVFPDGDIRPLSSLTHAAEQAGFEVRDVENLREHYAMTLRHWARGLEEHAEWARRLVDEVTYRTWRLYLTGSAHYFQTARLHLYQTLLVKNENGRSGMPRTRADWYTRQEVKKEKSDQSVNTDWSP